MFKRIVLTVVSVTLVTVMAFAVLSGVYAADEDRIYYSDLFFGFSPDYLNDKEVEKNVWEKYSSLRLHTRETGDIMEKIYNDYADSFAGFWSSFKTGLNYSTDAMFSLKFKDYANLMSDTYGNTEHIYTNSLDDANMEMVKYLLKTSVGDAALFGGNGTGVAAKTMKFMKDLAEFYEDIRENYVIEKMTDYEIVEIVFEEARNGGLFVHISSTNLTLVEEVILEDLSGYLKMFGAAAKAFEMMQTIFVGIMLEDVRMDVINDVISASSSDYCVYDGMIRLRDKLSGGFLEYFKNSYLQPKIIDKLHGEITDALLSPLGTTYGLIGDALSIASTVVFDILFDVPDLGEMTKQKTLASYSSELYEILRGKLLSFYGNVDSNDVRELESIFTAYIAATNAALEESRSMAKDNEEELEQLILVWEDYDYSTFIGEITESISSIPAAERELKDHGTVSNLTSTFRAASDVLEEDSIYLCNGAFNGSLSYNIDTTIKAEEGVVPYITGSLTITSSSYESKSVKIPEGLTLEIGGDVKVEGNSDYYAYLRNEGTLTVNGDITANSRGRYNAPSTNTSTLVVRGNVSFTEPYTVYGTVVFDGDEQQELDMSYVKNIEVTNEKGIKYLDNLYLEGNFKLNGNPLDLNGFNTYLEGNATLDGSDFHDVVVRSDYTLTYDVNANVMITASGSSSTSLTIPEDADVEINGNVNVSGTSDYYAYLKNYGRLTVNGDIKASSRGWYNAPSTNTSTLVVRGNVSFAETFTVYGTVVFDGDEQQELDMSYVKNIEVTNEKGIKYLDNLYLEGSFKLNGNPLELNGFNTYLEGNATLDGSDFHEVVIRSDYTLTYDVNANVKITTLGSSSMSLTIPEDADVEINGNVNVSGTSDYYAYLKNYGKLSVGGDLTVGNTGYYRDTEASTLVLKKNVSINSSIKGTVVFDGDEQQSADIYSAGVIEINNTSSNGVVFARTISISKLFDHKGNSFTLYNNGSGSTFVDHDGDGLNDNVDPHPTIKESEIEYTLTLKDENGEPIFSEVYKNGEEVHPPIIVPEESFTHTYTFLGWATSPMGAVEYPAGEPITISEDITLYAVVEKKAKPAFIVYQPTNKSAQNGEKVSTTVIAAGEGLTYTWYYTSNGNTTEFFVSSVTGATYTTVMNDSRAGRKVYCVITDKYGNSVTTEVVTLSMLSNVTITKQPANVTAANGETASTTVVAEGEGLTYTWYYTSNGNTTEFYVSSVTEATYTTVMNDSRAGRKVYCVITDKYGNSVTTDVVTLSMLSNVTITKQPTNITAANGEAASTTVVAEGEGLTYTWYYTLNKNGVEFYVSSVTGATYTTVMNDSRAGRKVYCVITDKYGNSVTTEVVTLSMSSGLAITKQPTNITAANGETASTTVAAEGEGLTYTWYYTSNGNSNQFFVSSVTGATYTTVMNDSRAGRKVYCVITDKYGNSVTTEVVTLSMSSELAITKQPTNVTAANGSKIETAVVATGEGLTYTWYYTSNGKTTEFYVSSVTGATYTTVMNDSRAGRKVYCVITDKYGNSVTTNIVTLTMK